MFCTFCTWAPFSAFSMSCFTLAWISVEKTMVCLCIDVRATNCPAIWRVQDPANTCIHMDLSNACRVDVFGKHDMLEILERVTIKMTWWTTCTRGSVEIQHASRANPKSPLLNTCCDKHSKTWRWNHLKESPKQSLVYENSGLWKPKAFHIACFKPAIRKMFVTNSETWSWKPTWKSVEILPKQSGLAKIQDCAKLKTIPPCFQTTLFCPCNAIFIEYTHTHTRNLQKTCFDSMQPSGMQMPKT